MIQVVLPNGDVRIFDPNDGHDMTDDPHVNERLAELFPSLETTRRYHSQSSTTQEGRESDDSMV